MSAFERIVNPATTVFGDVAPPESIRPGVRPEPPDEFRQEPGLKTSMRGSSTDELFEIWLERSRFIAQEARALAERYKSPATLARLAHAELAASDAAAAEAAASEAFDGLVNTQRRTHAGVDTAAAVSAAWALVLCGKREVAIQRLSTLPTDPPLRLMHAGLVADSDKPENALELLAGCAYPQADSLRGYVYLELNDPARALRELRRAYKMGDQNPDVCANMATAFWMLGSRRKAIKFARQAVKLASGRKDIVVGLLDYLIASRDLDSARKELRDLSARGFAENAELVERRALLAYLDNKPRIALNLLRQAESRANSAQNKTAATVINGRITFLQWVLGDISKAEATRKLCSLMTAEPNNFMLVYLFADLCDRAHMAPELRRRYETLRQNSTASELLLPIEVVLASLEGRFDELMSLTSEWTRLQPLNQSAADIAMLVNAYGTLDWQSAAMTANSLLKRFPWDGQIANNAAYIFVLAGRPQAAELALTNPRLQNKPPNYVSLATQGLIKIAMHDVQAGLRLYRRAAEAADHSPEGRLARVRVTIYQGLVLQLIGKYDIVANLATRAAALPPVELPADWQDIPELNQLAWISARAGFEWPPMLP